MVESIDLDLEKAATHLLEECRMVLPGIQALFGFQLIAVFSARFKHELTLPQQRLHLLAVMCVVLSVALVMAPAAIHRRREPRSISSKFLRASSMLLMLGMVPLAIATVVDVYLVATAITHERLFSWFAAGVAAAAFVGLWGVLPSVLRLGPADSATK